MGRFVKNEVRVSERIGKPLLLLRRPPVGKKPSKRTGWCQARKDKGGSSVRSGIQLTQIGVNADAQARRRIGYPRHSGVGDKAQDAPSFSFSIIYSGGAHIVFAISINERFIPKAARLRTDAGIFGGDYIGFVKTLSALDERSEDCLSG